MSGDSAVAVMHGPVTGNVVIMGQLGTGHYGGSIWTLTEDSLYVL